MISTRRARGITLLEVLIATTILASLTVIVATLWAQTERWTDETRTHDTALRLQRALDLMDRQWRYRLPDAQLADGLSGAVTVDGEHLSFVTTESALFPGWPLVQACYTVTGARDSSGTTGWRLEYRELRLGTTTDAESVNALESGETGTLASLRSATLAALEGRAFWSAVLADEQIAEWEAASGKELEAEQPAEEDSDGTEEADRSQRWITLTGDRDRRWAGIEAATNPDAVRLDGVTREGGFRWALVGEPLR